MMVGQQSLETFDQRRSAVTTALVTPPMDANKDVLAGQGLVAETGGQPSTYQMIFDEGRQIRLLHSTIAHRIRKHKNIMAWAAARIITSRYLDFERQRVGPRLNCFRESLQKPTVRFNPIRPIRPSRANEQMALIKLDGSRQTVGFERDRLNVWWLWHRLPRR
jgi:hypothetical protein